MKLRQELGSGLDRRTCVTRDRFATLVEDAAENRLYEVGRDHSIVRHERGFEEDSGDELVDEFLAPVGPAAAHEPRLVQLNLRASLMGVHIVDDEELFFSRQSSMSSMLSEKFRVRRAGTSAAHAVRHAPAMANFKCKMGVAATAAAERPPLCSNMAHRKFACFHDEFPLVTNSCMSATTCRSTSGVISTSKRQADPLVSAYSWHPVAPRGAGSSRAHSGVVLYPSLSSQGPEARAKAAGVNGSMSLQSAASRGGGDSAINLSHRSSGILSPQAPPGTRAHSGLLNADQGFGMEAAALATTSAATTSAAGDPPLNDKTFNQLLGRSRLSQMGGQTRREGSRESLDEEEEASFITRPLSTHESLQESFPVSPSTSERPFGVRSTREQSLGDGVAHGLSLGSMERVDQRPKSQLAHYLMAINAMTDYGTDDDDIVREGPSRGPSEVAWHQPEEQLEYHPRHPVVQACIQAHDEDQPKACPDAHERWTSNSTSWNLSLVQKPSKRKPGAGCIAMHRNKQHYNSATVSTGRSRNLRLLAKDFLVSVSGRSDSGSLGNGIKSDQPGSGRSRWPRLRSWRRGSSGSTSSGRLQIESSFQGDSDETDHNVQRLKEQNEAQVDEDDFPFDSAVASSFIFGGRRVTGGDGGLPACVCAAAGGRNLVGEYEEDWHCNNDHFHEADAARSSTEYSDDTGSSLEFSAMREDGALGFLDQPTQWVPSRSCYDLKEVLNRSIRISSSRAFSGYLEYGRSGRFRVDLQPEGPRLENSNRPRLSSPDVTTELRIINTGRRRPSFYKRLMLSSPCMPFSERHKQSQNVQRRIKQAASSPLQMLRPAAAAAGGAALVQPVNSFRARLGPLHDTTTTPTTGPNFQIY